jgi:hypothetical protein
MSHFNGVWGVLDAMCHEWGGSRLWIKFYRGLFTRALTLFPPDLLIGYMVANSEISRHWGVCPELFEYFEDVLTPEQICEAKLWAKRWKAIEAAS